jgi:hypothetical protein
VPRGESLPGLVGLRNVDGDRFTDVVIAERVEQRLGDLRMFGKERSDLVAATAFP